MAFPSESRISEDADFLKPFKPEDFGSNQVHVTRGPDAGFLYRIDPLAGGGVVILVQSAAKPNWGYAFCNADHLLAAPPEVNFPAFSFSLEQHLRFRLVANPTRKIDTKSGPDGCRRNGKRVPVRTNELYNWLARRADPAGFSIDRDSTAVQAGYIYVNKTSDGPGQRLRSVRYDGILKITDPAHFQESLICGIGPAKAFGFGLLSVAPVKP
jgi:CRISPR system Cascade subunit CasE